jgi:hypothetical protein
LIRSWDFYVTVPPHDPRSHHCVRIPSPWRLFYERNLIDGEVLLKDVGRVLPKNMEILELRAFGHRSRVLAAIQGLQQSSIKYQMASAHPQGTCAVTREAILKALVEFKAPGLCCHNSYCEDMPLDDERINGWFSTRPERINLFSEAIGFQSRLIGNMTLSVLCLQCLRPI